MYDSEVHHRVGYWSSGNSYQILNNKIPTVLLWITFALHFTRIHMIDNYMYIN